MVPSGVVVADVAIEGSAEGAVRRERDAAGELRFSRAKEGLRSALSPGPRTFALWSRPCLATKAQNVAPIYSTPRSL